MMLLKIKKYSSIFLISVLLLSGCKHQHRVGAICNDGWQSSATGRGACSHHGGVDHWIYEDDKK